MQSELFDVLKGTAEYKKYRRSKQARSIGAMIALIAFWALIISTTNFSNIDNTSFIYFGILTVSTVFLLKYVYIAFFKRPQIISYGTIMDIRENRRTVREEDQLQTRETYQFLVHCEGNDYWSDCVYDFIDGHGKRYSVGESVIFFSTSPGNNYIIRLCPNRVLKNSYFKPLVN